MLLRTLPTTERQPRQRSGNPLCTQASNSCSQYGMLASFRSSPGARPRAPRRRRTGRPWLAVGARALRAALAVDLDPGRAGPGCGAHAAHLRRRRIHLCPEGWTTIRLTAAGAAERAPAFGRLRVVSGATGAVGSGSCRPQKLPRSAARGTAGSRKWPRRMNPRRRLTDRRRRQPQGVGLVIARRDPDAGIAAVAEAHLQAHRVGLAEAGGIPSARSRPRPRVAVQGHVGATLVAGVTSPPVTAGDCPPDHPDPGETHPEDGEAGRDRQRRGFGAATTCLLGGCSASSVRGQPQHAGPLLEDDVHRDPLVRSRLEVGPSVGESTARSAMNRFTPSSRRRPGAGDEATERIHRRPHLGKSTGSRPWRSPARRPVLLRNRRVGPRCAAVRSLAPNRIERRMPPGGDVVILQRGPGQLLLLEQAGDQVESQDGRPSPLRARSPCSRSAARTVPLPSMVRLMPRPWATSWNMTLSKKAFELDVRLLVVGDQLAGDGDENPVELGAHHVLELEPPGPFPELDLFVVGRLMAMSSRRRFRVARVVERVRRR